MEHNIVSAEEAAGEEAAGERVCGVVVELMDALIGTKLFGRVVVERFKIETKPGETELVHKPQTHETQNLLFWQYRGTTCLPA